MQNKTAEAQRVFETIPAMKNNQLYDYMAAYMGIHDPDGMRALGGTVDKYLSSSNIGPALRAKWQALRDFLNELKNMDDFTGEFVYETKAERRKRLEKILKIEPDGSHIVKHKNLKRVTVKVYKIDIELMFSTAPFTQVNKSYRYVEPTQVFEKELPQGDGLKETRLSDLVALNSEAAGDNYLFEVISEDFCETDVMYVNDFEIQRSETEIRILRRNEGTPVVKAYVKIYAKTASCPEGEFYKDGYTDLRGRFDYYTVASNHVESVEKFAILVKTVSSGANVLYLQPAVKK